MTRKAGNPSRRSAPRLREQMVLDYLRDHPHFLADHADVLDRQSVPVRDHGEGVVDLQKFIVEKLRADNAALRSRQEEIIANGRDNLATQERVHGAVMELLEAESFTQFVEIIVQDLALYLDVDAVRLCIEQFDLAFQAPRPEGLRLLKRGTIGNYLAKGQRVLLREDASHDPEIFGEVADLIRSDALVRLAISPAAPPAMLVFGTRHPGYFHAGQGTELLSFLARVISFGIRSWLNLPSP
ncbi:MAG TPA: DUF484 family protein [Dongiaceae bacterium]|jgi:hypothetical protein|nr:DUF484 family protein [Dongiaceae bacterium]